MIARFKAGFLLLLILPLGLTARGPGPVVPQQTPADKPKSNEPPFLGVSLQDVTITQVWDNSTAKKMGMRIGDVLVSWCSNPTSKNPTWSALDNIDDLRAQLTTHKVGDLISLKIRRSGKIIVVSGKLKPRPDVNKTDRISVRGLLGKPLVDWEVTDWFQTNAANPPKLADYKDKILVICCFQHWCPGSRSFALPLMARAEKTFKEDDKIHFLYLQTTIEGPLVNTFDNGCQDIRDHKLTGPFGHTTLKDGRSIFFDKVKAAGTPWIMVVGPKGIVRFNNFRFKGKKLDKAEKHLTDYLNRLKNDRDTPED